MHGSTASPGPEDGATRERLLRAAGEAIAEHGYRAATVRDICQRAQANVAAVNYHFGDKLHLYLEVMADALRKLHRRYPIEGGLPLSADPRARLSAYVHAFLMRVASSDMSATPGILLTRELAQPSGALDPLIEEFMRPHFELLVELIGALLGERATPQECALCARSVLGQCLVYRFAWPVLSRLSPGEHLDDARVAHIAAHVTRFSLDALEQRRAQLQRMPR